MRASDTALHIVAWFVAVNLICFHGLLAFFTWWPLDFWFVYHGVRPAKTSFAVNEKLKFVSHTDLNKDLILTFNDILFCREPIAGDLIRYSAQNTKRLHNIKGVDRYTTWPYSPGVAYPTECCLESNIELHLPLGVERSFRYDGCLEGHMFPIIEP